jgi:hypothetical protein
LWRWPEELPTVWEGRVLVFAVIPLFWGGFIFVALYVLLLLFGVVWREVRAYADPRIRRLRWEDGPGASGAGVPPEARREAIRAGAPPAAPGPSRYPPPEGPEVGYALGAEDYVAWWVYSTERTGAYRRLRSYRFLKWVVWLPLVALALPGAACMVALAYSLPNPFVVLVMGLGAAILLGMWGWFVRQRPAGLFRQLARDSWLRGLRQAAADLERRREHLNPARVHRLTIHPYGFTLVAEARFEQSGAQVYEYREDVAGWDILADVVVTDRHLFLLAKDGTACIVPLRCFPDEGAASRFVETVRGHHRAATSAPV